MQLRGFDSYEVTLGDLMRGERASMGKSLIDAERDMRIKANLIDAIENCDISAFKNHGVISGYVRSYARYLGMDSDAAFKRFCDEAGFRPPSLDLGAQPDPRRSGQQAVAAGTSPLHALSQSRFAVPPAPSRLSVAVSLSGIASVAVLMALVAGLGYGGYALLQEIQRVGFVPLPEAPIVVAEAPVIAAPDAAAERPDPSVYQADGALAALALPSDLAPRDVPISMIDPETSGVYAPPAPPEPLPAPEPQDAIEAGIADLGIRDAAASLLAATTPAPPPGVTVVALDEAWVRVRDGSDAIIFEGILRAGVGYTVPEDVSGAILRAGNAGDVFIKVDGHTFGPVGAPGSVVRAVSLAAEDVRAAWPEVDGPAVLPATPEAERAASN